MANEHLTGKIFSMEEFSTYDGPGIRMTVFLKGCPLRCMWCHNPEGQRFESEMIRSPNGCLGCGACQKAGEEKTGHPCLVEESAEVCPRHLVRRCGNDRTPEELVSLLKKNLFLLNRSGGGVTFSGGEPLSQADFVLACLGLLRNKTHRALQTCGYAPPEVFDRVLRECDFVLYDLKLMDEESHRRYTGVSNRVILENYRTLAESGIPFCTRIPLIPSVNDTEENLRETARFLQSNRVRYVEILPYNRMAGGKYAAVGRTYAPTFDETVAPNPHREIFEQFGIEVKIL